MPARIVVLTRAWPYPPGEQFVDEEAPSWVRPDAEVVVMPWWARGEPAMVPASLKVDLTLARRSRAQDVRAIASQAVSPLVLAEVAGLFRAGELSRRQLVNVARTARGALLARDQLRAWIRRNGPIDVVYSYWFDSWTLGALMLKGDGIGHVASRVHGYDLYEDRHPDGRHALRRALVDRLDLLLPVSRSGGRHAVASYGIDPAVVAHAPLGVTLPQEQSPVSPGGELHLLSVASCLPVKRIDRLVDATALLATQHPELQVRWTHLGGGALLDELRARVARSPLQNLAVEMPGQVTAARVREHLSTDPVDLFVNTSASEGVPVSIMEAMAFGVPVLAPRVGAVDEIVPDDAPAGRLLGAEPTPQDVADAMWQMHQACKQPAARQEARRIVVEGYQTQVNARLVMDRLVQLADGRPAEGEDA